MNKRIPKKVLKEIHNTIKYVWEYDIPKDYENGYLLKEDTFKNSLYFHLRTRLASLLDKYSIMIFTEYDTDKFGGKGRRADIVIAQMDLEDDEIYLCDCVKEYISVFELKYQGDASRASELIYEDYNKVKNYIESYDLGEDCHYYVATIWECRPDSKWWLDKETEWAKGRLTELNADYDSKEEMSFYIKEHK